MSLEKAVVHDGREVWLAVLAAPEEASRWSEQGLSRAGVLAYLDGWDDAALGRFCAEMLKIYPSEMAFGGACAQAARAALSRVAPALPGAARDSDEPLDESVWYMVHSSYEPDAATRRQPPLIAAFGAGDPRIAEFKRLAARFAAAMKDVFDRE
jgi:hypothetical protein